MFVAAAVTTAVLSLDTTIVLLTPVAVLTARRVGVRVAPIGYASSHLSNSSSTLLPVSNLTNLLAFGATGLGFVRFTGYMVGPWIAAIVVEYLVFRWFFADALRTRTRPSRTPGDSTEQGDHGADDAGEQRAPTAMLIALGLLLAGFVAAEPLGVPLWVVATIGAVGMAAESRWRAPVSAVADAVRSANVPFLVFVAALGVVILPVRDGPVGAWCGRIIPSDNGFWALLATAAIAAVAANVLNNLPATLLLVPLVSGQPALVLAVLLGVNIGPNLALFGSLANLLWRDVMRQHSARAPTRTHLLLGAVSVPPTLLAAVTALWAGLRLW